MTLSCELGICVAPPATSVNALGQPCNQDDDCALYREAIPLSCQSGRCELTGCPTATAGCPCGSEESCAEGASCAESGFCLDPTCELGQLHCPCSNDGGCVGGAQCVADICRANTQFALSITDASIRGCQARIELPPEVSVEVRFAPPLRGQQARRGGALALSFVNRLDSSTEGQRVLLSLTSADVEVQLARVKCVDRLGRALRGDGLSLHRVSP